MKKKVLIIGALLLTLGVGSASAATEKNVVINGNTVVFNQSPIVKNGVTLVEFRPVFQELGLGVTYNSEKKQVTGTKNESSIVLNIGSKKATVNGSEVLLDVAPQVVNNRVLVPLRFVSETIGGTVNIQGNSIQISVPEVTTTVTPVVTTGNGYTTDADKEYYLNKWFSGITYGGKTIDAYLGSNNDDSDYAVIINLSDLKEAQKVLDFASDDEQSINKMVQGIANKVHTEFGEDEFTIILLQDINSLTDPSNAFNANDTTEITQLPDGTYNVVSAMFGVNYDFNEGTYLTVSFSAGKAVQIDSGELK